MKKFRAELHAHTVLSPCADVEMLPPLIVEEALFKGIQLLAITDHNSTLNIEAVMDAASGSELMILPGLELQTVEEIHVLCLFDELDQARAMQDLIYPSLTQPNNIDFFGEQFLVDKTGDFIGREERLLLMSSQLDLPAAWAAVQDLSGILIPAHVNRNAFGLFQVLGFIPTDIPLEVLEISSRITPEKAIEQYPSLKEYGLTQNGDAHFLEDILGFNHFRIESPTIAEIRLALLHQEGRSHYLRDPRLP